MNLRNGKSSVGFLKNAQLMLNRNNNGTINQVLCSALNMRRLPYTPKIVEFFMNNVHQL
jgi:hypothetical protein